MNRIIRLALFIQCAAVLAACASIYPERFTYEEGLIALQTRELCCKSFREVEYLKVAENGLEGWVVGLDETDKVLQYNGTKSFYKAFEFADRKYAEVHIETYPISHSISGNNLYIFLPTTFFLDENYNEVHRVEWRDFEYSGRGASKKFESTTTIPFEAKYLLTLSEKKNLSGSTQMLLTVLSPQAQVTQETGSVKNAPIGHVIYKFGQD